MNKFFLILSFTFILSLFSVNASIYSLTLSWDDFMDLNTNEEIRAYVKTNATTYTNDTDVYNVTLTLTLLNGSRNNYSFAPATEKYWNLLISDTVEEDLNFTVFVRNESTHVIYKQESGQFKFRQSFFLTIQFFKGKNVTLFYTNPNMYSAYCNEFQIIYFQKKNTTGLNWGGFAMFQDMRYLDRWFGWVPFYEPAFSVPAIDYTLTYWSWYEGCDAEIKLYESGNYSIGLVNYEWKVITTGMGWPYEFIKPQFRDERKKFDSTIIDTFAVANETNQSYHIFLTDWEIDANSVMMNVGKWIFLICLWIGGIILLGVLNVKAAGVFAAGYWIVLKTLGWI